MSRVGKEDGIGRGSSAGGERGEGRFTNRSGEVNRPEGGAALLTLEPLVEAVREGIEQAGWTLSGLQKTTSHEFAGSWAGESTRSAYLFFHRDDLPESVSIEAFLDETSDGLRGNLALVLDGPRLGRVGPPAGVLERLIRAAGETLPEGYRTPVSLRLTAEGRMSRAEEAGVEARIKLLIPRTALEAGASAVASLASFTVSAFESLLECPEAAELLPPVVD